MNPEEWPAGFAKRTEVLVGQDQEEIQRWSAEEVRELREKLGREPKGYELSEHFESTR